MRVCFADFQNSTLTGTRSPWLKYRYDTPTRYPFWCVRFPDVSVLESQKAMVRLSDGGIGQIVMSYRKSLAHHAPAAIAKYPGMREHAGARSGRVVAAIELSAPSTARVW